MVDFVVYEFYTSLKDRKNRKQQGETITHTVVWGKEVSIAHQVIFQYYNSPYYTYCHLHPILLIEPFTRPMKSVIGDNLYNKFLELQCKKNQEKRKGQSIEVTHSGADEAKG
ncbi:hypothetical protein PVK06_012006 [Gossypium arboreum]|uniref:Uncharacterized protein n=1 Tax=Gossypium arboreum TaxID=29729 RepID=A0ABR0QAB3_GOSAR|nr:hypothetical protein PVK06_012006 [Gossypium arboreum]